MSGAPGEGSAGCLVVCGHRILVGAEQEGREIKGQLGKGIQRAFEGINKMTSTRVCTWPSDTSSLPPVFIQPAS